MESKVAIYKCVVCSKEFKRNPSAYKKGGRTCSRKCGYKARVLLPNSGQFKKGNVPHNAFTGWSEDQKKKMSDSRKKSKYRTGENHPRWDGGVQKNGSGYLREYTLGETSNRKYQHRKILERIIGRSLDSTEVVHHVNGIKSDNRPENLMLFTNNTVHMKFHQDENSVSPNEILFDGRKYGDL